MLKCARCDGQNLPHPKARCSGKSGRPCVYCDAPLSVQGDGRVYCLNGHPWGTVINQEALPRYYAQQVQAMRQGKGCGASR